MKDNPEEEVIENTFLPRCRNKKFSIVGLDHLVRHGFIKDEDIPEDIRIKVLEYRKIVLAPVS